MAINNRITNGHGILYFKYNEGWMKQLQWKSLSGVWLFVTPTYSMKFSRPEYWSG